MRYRGKFQRSKYPVTAVDVTDEGEVLEQKWKHWVEMEQWKRYVLAITYVERRRLTEQARVSLLYARGSDVHDYIDESVPLVLGAHPSAAGIAGPLVCGERS